MTATNNKKNDDVRQIWNKTQCDELYKNNDANLPEIFGSTLSYFTKYGYVEPLLPPMRHPKWCLPPPSSSTRKKKNHPPYLLDILYLVHDFAQFCRNIPSHAKTIFVDLGASLQFDFHKKTTPVLQLLELYRDYGNIRFDHIYAFELKPENPKDVFAKLPRHLFPAYHWINVGINTDVNSPFNPWNLLRDQYVPDDFVVIKLDVDKTSIEVELIRQLLQDPQLIAIVDVLYWEHHVSLTEWYPYQETMEKSLKLFAELRAKGIAAHYWV
jgi:hypothetical protein